MIPLILMDKDFREAMIRERKAEAQRRMRRAVPWDPKMKWEKSLAIQANTYSVRDLFPDLLPGHSDDASAEIWQCGPDYYVESPCGTWRYAKMTLPKGCSLWTAYGSKKGSVLFDGEIVAPGVWQRPKPWGPLKEPEDCWGMSTAPWMSMTPTEIFSLRTGIRRAKGNDYPTL